MENLPVLTFQEKANDLVLLNRRRYIIKKIYIDNLKIKIRESGDRLVCPLQSTPEEDAYCCNICAWFDVHKIKAFPLLTLSDNTIGVITCKNSVIGELVDPPEVKP